jgi:hypothetical protein
VGANKERALTDWREDERVRRQAAEDDEVVPGSSEPIEPTRLQQLISVRLDPEVITALRTRADEQETTISSLVRAAIAELLANDTKRVTDLSVVVEVAGWQSVMDSPRRSTTLPALYPQDDGAHTRGVA